ncbi:MAG: T9SS type A sorting domain-containing protein [Flavobacteriaceae bacterium]|nr:T9SS type A sorting domain-containing protein [Flavobacteriaceae bacterium]
MRFTVSIVLIFCLKIAIGQNPLYIPPALTGTTFNLNMQAGTKVFYDSTKTPTFGINGVWLSPTIIVNKGDSITLNVKNGLNEKTTMHWHGLHVAAMNDGGPHQIIKPNTTWSPSFKVRNNAGTFWYHPHGAGQTDPQVSKGLAGLFIVKDNDEATLALPRTYGVDDIPIIIQSKAFDDLKQIAIATDMDTALFVNGTLHPLATLPAQVIRLRLLNGSSLRSYNLGFSNGQTFYQIGTDGGLIDTPLSLTRLRLSPGERVEVLVNFSGMIGQKVELKSYASEMKNGIYGADTVGFGADTIHEYADNFLNGADFNLLLISIDSATANLLNAIPVSLVPYIPFNAIAASKFRTIVFDTLRLLPADAPNLAEGPFGMNNRTFDMDSINEVVHLGTTEIWTLVNKTLVAHPFHIHDIQFNVIEKSGMSPPPSEMGWKDVVLVMPNDSVKFITKFETFSDPMVPHMYHCHLLHHEDDGMMGSFLVIDTTVTGINETSIENRFSIYPNPTTDELNITSINNEKFSISIFNALGQQLYSTQAIANCKLPFTNYTTGIYFIQISSRMGAYTQKIVKL